MMIKNMNLENMPKKNGAGANFNSVVIDWTNCKDSILTFNYDGIKGELKILKYISKTRKVLIEYNNDEFEILTDSLAKCKIGYILGVKKHTFEYNIGDVIHTNNGKIEITNRQFFEYKSKLKGKYYQYKCLNCGYNCCEHYKSGIIQKELWMTEYKINGKAGCSCCCIPSKIVVVGINDIVTTAPWMIPYIGLDVAKCYTNNSAKSVKVTCPDCDTVKNKQMTISTVYAQKSIGCVCGDGFSSGHKYIFSLLKQLNLDFKDNCKFNWCQYVGYDNTNKQINGEYDFAIEDMKLIIEVDGAFHIKDNKMSGQTKEHSKYLDDMKDKLAIENGYSVIRINSYNCDIKDKILQGALNVLFDLSIIDWNKCEEFSLSNRVKEACKIKRLNQDMTCTEIGLIMNLERATISRYLKQGHRLEWCYYNSDEEISKCAVKCNMLKRKPVECIGIDGISLGLFESCTDFENKSLNLLGFKIMHQCVSSVANGKLKSHKGLTFKYVS